MVSVIDVASYILQQRGSMTTMKLQKLCYYSQAWNLAWDEKPLFHEPIQAWANGPVVYALFERHRGKFVVEQDDIAGNPEALDRDERETIDAVLDAYGHLTRQQFSDIAHTKHSWKPHVVMFLKVNTAQKSLILTLCKTITAVWPLQLCREQEKSTHRELKR